MADGTIQLHPVDHQAGSPGPAWGLDVVVTSSAGRGASPTVGWRGFSRRRSALGFFLILPALALVVMFFLVPLGLSAWMSLTKWNLAGFQEFVGLDNYLDIARDRQFAGALLFATGYTVVVTLATFVLGFGLALLVRSGQRRVAVLRTMFFLPVVIGTATASFIFVWLFNDQVGAVNGLLRTLGLIEENVVWLAHPQTAFLTIIVMMTWKNAGFAMIIMLIGMQAIPDELYEAARVDGASAWAMLRRITVPLLLPTIALVTILLSTDAYLAFDQFFIITGGGPNSATVTPVFWIYNQTFLGFRFGYSSALSIVLLMLLVTLGAIQLRVLRRDLTEA